MRGATTRGGGIRERASRWQALAAAVAVTSLYAGPALALPNQFNYFTGAGEQNWSSPANWTQGTPGAEDHVRIISSGTLNIDSPGAKALSIAVGYGNNLTPTVNLKAGGSLVSGNDVIFGGTGAEASSNNVLATFNQTGGDLLIPANRILWMGLGGNAVWNMSGGTTTVGYPGFSSLTNLGISIGTGVGALASTATLNMTGGTINSDAVFEVARGNATGNLNMSGGTINVGTEVWIGQFGTGGGLATINHSGGTINTGYNQPGVNSFSGFLMGIGNAGKPATYTLSGTGAVNVHGHMYVGGGVSALAGATGGEGTFNMNGGTVSVGAARQVSGSSLYIGWSAGAADSKGAVVVNNGTLSLNLPGSEIVVGSFQNNTAPFPTGQSASLTINGGQVLNPRGAIVLGRNGANGTVNLAGGVLSVNSLVWANFAGNTNVRQFNFTGGTFEANAAQLGNALTNAGGTFRPGGSALRTFTTTGGSGSYVQNAGTLALDVASAASFDALDTSAATTGAVQLNGGTVNVTTLGGYAPAFGVTVPVITAKTISDAATWNLPALPAGVTWDKRITTDGTKQVESITAIRAAASTLSSGTNWTAATWSSGTPNAVDASAKLAGAGGSISVNAPVTVGYLQLDGSAGWTVDGAGPLTISTAGGATGGIVAFGPANHSITVPVAFNSNAAIATQLRSTAVTLAGAVSGAATVEKTGPGSLTLASAVSPFTGTWKISGGSLNFDSDANLGAPAAKLSLANATLNVTGGLNSARAITLDGINTLSAGGDTTLSGPIDGPGGLTKTDANVLTLGGTNTYAGPTNINAGTLRQSAASAVPSTSALTLAANTTFDLAGSNASVGSIAGSGNITTGGANLTVGNDNTSTVFSGIVSGGGTFTKNGTGTLQFERPAGATGSVVPIDGNIVVNGGTLQFNRLNQLSYDLPASDIMINAGATLALGSIDPNGGAFFNRIQGAGSVSITTSFLVQLTENNDYTGGTVITNGATASITQLSSLGAAGTPIHFKGSGTRDLGYAGGLWFEIGDHVTPTAGTFSHPISVDGWKIAILSARGNDITLDQPISGDGVIQWANGGFGGTFRLNAVNTYRGVSQVDGGTNIVLGVDNALPHGAVALIDTATLDLSGHNQTIGYLVSAGTPTVKLTSGTLTIKSDIEDQFFGAWGGTMTGNGSLVKSGGATQVFSLAAGFASTYTGGTTVEQGTLQIIGNVNALPAGGPVTVNQGGVLQFTTDAISSGLAAGTPVTFAGNISGTGEVQVTTLETLALSGNNTYSGGTRISNGTLRVSADSNLGAPAGRITFYSNGSNPGPILQYAAPITSARDLVVENAFGYVDTNGFDVTVGNIVGNTDPRFPLGSFRKLFGAGTLTANRVRVNGLTVSAGTLKVAPGGTASSTSSSTSLVIEAGASLDLSDNDMVVDYTGTSPLTDVVASLKAAYNSGAWDGAGLTSSTASAAAANGRTTLAVVENSIYGLSTFGGLPVDATSILVKYTWYGDVNLNGRVDADDFAVMDRSFAMGGLAGSATWANGDINYSGTVDAADYLLIDRTFALQTGTLSPTLLAHRGAQFGPDYVSALVASVPEPGTLSILAIPAAALTSRRRRRC